MPYTIMDNYLPSVLTVTDANYDVGNPKFKFSYGDGTYQIGENGCTCQDASNGLQGAQAYKCSFPLNGDS